MTPEMDHKKTLFDYDSKCKLRFSDFRITVNGLPTIVSNSCFLLPANSFYKLKFTNRTLQICEYTISVDRLNIGTFRLNGRQTLSIERPVSSAMAFQFIRGIGSTSPYGSVTIEEKLCIDNYDYSNIETDGCSGFTVLNGPSKQSFTLAPEMDSQTVGTYHFKMEIGDADYYILQMSTEHYFNKILNAGASSENVWVE